GNYELIKLASSFEAAHTLIAFDGKEGLFRAAVDSYVDRVDELLVGPLRDGTGGLEDLLAFTNRQREPLTDPCGPPGCLIINAMVTGDAPEATQRYLDDFRTAIDSALTRAADLGEVSPDDRSAQAATFLASVLGANLAAKSVMSQSELHELIDGLRATVRSWRIPNDR
ncbi:MAG: TetR/AcrR family transcriptional regulator, partial [Acidimicrobiales bacterium]